MAWQREQSDACASAATSSSPASASSAQAAIVSGSRHGPCDTDPARAFSDCRSSRSTVRSRSESLCKLLVLCPWCLVLGPFLVVGPSLVLSPQSPVPSPPVL